MVCPHCAAALQLAAGALACPNGCRYPLEDGYYDLTTAEEPAPSWSLFNGPWGRLFSRGIKSRRFSIAINPVWAGFSSALLRRMYAQMDAAVTCEPDVTLLDAPAGGGTVLQRARGVLRGRYVGLDLSPAQLGRASRMVQRAHLGERALLVRADATRIPLADGSVDRVLSFNGLHLIVDKDAVLSEFHRCLVPGGEIIGSTLVEDERPVRRRTYPWFFCTRIVPMVTAQQFEQTARAAGFDDWEQKAEGAFVVFRGRRS